MRLDLSLLATSDEWTAGFFDGLSLKFLVTEMDDEDDEDDDDDEDDNVVEVVVDGVGSAPIWLQV